MASTAQSPPLSPVLSAGAVSEKQAGNHPASDEAAVEACQGGEREAFDALVLRYQRRIYGLCFRYVNNHEDANDLTQEVFVRAWRGIKSFRGQSAFSTWLYRIGVNACLNFRARRRPQSVELPEALPDSGVGVDRRLEEDDRARRVREAVRRLPEKQRATLILKVYQDLTHREVAEVLGSTVGTVKANLFHALGNLRKLVAEEGETKR